MSIGVFTRPVNRGDGRVNADEIRGNDNALGQAVAALQAVIDVQQAAIPDPTGGTVQDSEARTAIIAILNALRAHGLIDT